MRSGQRFWTLGLALLGALWLGLSPSQAQEGQRKLLLIPFDLGGTYRPVSSEEFSDLIRQSLAKVAPGLEVVLSQESAFMMTPEKAARLGKAAGADYVLYGDMRFRKDLKGASVTGGPPEGYPGGSGIQQGFSARYLLTISGIGHGRLVDVATAELIAERPELLLESEYTGAPDGSAAMETMEKRLAGSCVGQMADHLVSRLKQQATKTKAK